jgi:hypothetical protein
MMVSSVQSSTRKGSNAEEVEKVAELPAPPADAAAYSSSPGARSIHTNVTVANTTVNEEESDAEKEIDPELVHPLSSSSAAEKEGHHHHVSTTATISSRDGAAGAFPKIMTLQDWAEFVKEYEDFEEVSLEQIERVRVVHDRFLEDCSLSFNYNTLLLCASILAGLGLGKCLHAPHADSLVRTLTKETGRFAFSSPPFTLRYTQSTTARQLSLQACLSPRSWDPFRGWVTELLCVIGRW